MESETAVSGMRVQDTETAMMQVQEHLGNIEQGRSTTPKPEWSFEGLLNAIGDNLSYLARSEDEEDGEDKNDDEVDKGHGKLSEDHQPWWVTGTISKTVQHLFEIIRQKLLKLDELPDPDWGNVANYFNERDMKYRMIELMVLAVGKPQTDMTAATPATTTFGELMEAVDIVPGQSKMPQVTPRQGSSPMRMGLENAQADNHVVQAILAAVP